jgi:uncharacterized protein (DUF697 family)
MPTQSIHSTVKDSRRNKMEANALVRRKTLYAAGAGLIPIPILDVATLLGVQVTMIKQIADIYEVEHNYKKKWFGDIITALVGDLATVGVVSAVKAIPIVGTVIGIFTSPLTSASATYALGRVFIQHFDQGGTLLDFDPVTSRKLFNEEYKRGHEIVTEEVIGDQGTPGSDETIQNLENRIQELTNMVTELKEKVEAQHPG